MGGWNFLTEFLSSNVHLIFCWKKKGSWNGSSKPYSHFQIRYGTVIRNIWTRGCRPGGLYAWTILVQWNLILGIPICKFIFDTRYSRCPYDCESDEREVHRCDSDDFDLPSYDSSIVKSASSRGRKNAVVHSVLHVFPPRPSALYRPLPLGRRI